MNVQCFDLHKTVVDLHKTGLRSRTSNAAKTQPLEAWERTFRREKLDFRELKQRRRQRQRKRHPKICLYFICASRLFQLAQLLQKWRTIQELNW